MRRYLLVFHNHDFYDILSGNYTRRLAKRLIFGQSSNTEAERVMIEKLKTVCV